MINFCNSSIRRQDRLLDEDQALALLQRGEYGVLSMHTEAGLPYGIPINYVWDKATSIYLHCAPEGKKLNCLRHCTEVSFAVVGSTQVHSSRFTTDYESLILSCTASIVSAADERLQALELLLDKYSPQDKVVGLKYMAQSLHRTVVVRLDIHAMSGKTKRVK